MKKSKKLLALISSVTMFLCLIGNIPAVSAENTVPEPWILTVNALAGSSVYYLNNGCMLSQNEFETYSGEKFDLEYGDVIKVYCWTILVTDPGRFAWSYSDNDPKIEYVGKAADYYETKELTVLKTNGSSVTFTDDSGDNYLWNNLSSAEECGFKVPDEFRPECMESGQKFTCAVSSEGNHVIIPVSSSDDSSENTEVTTAPESTPIVTTIYCPTEPEYTSAMVTSIPHLISTTEPRGCEGIVTVPAPETTVSLSSQTDVTTVVSDVTTVNPDVTTADTKVTTQPVTVVGNIYEVEKDGIIKKDIACDWGERLPYGWTGNGDLTQTNDIGWFREDFGELVDIIYRGEPVNKTDYTVVQEGNESITITFNEEYLKTLPAGKHFFTLEFEKNIISNGIAFAVAGKGDINADSEVDLYDVIKIAEYIIGKVQFSESVAGFADINNDGKVDLYDAIRLSEYILKPNGTLPYIEKPVSALENNINYDKPTESNLRGIANGDDSFSVSDTVTESVKYNTSELKTGQKLNKNDILVYDEKDVGMTAKVLNKNGSFDVIPLTDDGYALPFNAEVAGFDLLNIWLAPELDGIEYIDVRTLEAGDIIDNNTYLICYDYSLNKSVQPIAAPSYFDKLRGVGEVTVGYVLHDEKIISISKKPDRGDYFLYKSIHLPGCDGNHNACGYELEDCCIGVKYAEIPSIYNNLQIYSIADEAFSKHSQLKDIYILSNVKNIGKKAFEGCTSLEKITLSLSLYQAGEYMLKDCTSLKTADISKCNFNLLGKGMFYNCTSLKNIQLPEYKNFDTIMKSSFESCISLEEITIPLYVDYIGEAAFKNCESLEKITVLDPECKIFDDSETIDSNAVIYGYAGSTAQEYAEKYNREFVPIGRGDVNTDGKFSIADIVMLKGYLTGKQTLTDTQIKCAEINGDGKVDVFDAVAIKRELIKENSKPAEYVQAYIDMIKAAESENINYRYDLIDIDGNDVPELVVDHCGYFFSLYTFADGKVHTLMDKEGYGTFNSIKYRYIPSENYIHYSHTEYAGYILHDIFYEINDSGAGLSRYTSFETTYFDDKNDNGVPDEDESFDARTVKHYNWGRNNMSCDPELYNSYIKPDAKYENIEGKLDFDEIYNKLIK